MVASTESFGQFFGDVSEGIVGDVEILDLIEVVHEGIGEGDFASFVVEQLEPISGERKGFQILHGIEGPRDIEEPISVQPQLLELRGEGLQLLFGNGRQPIPGEIQHFQTTKGLKNLADAFQIYIGQTQTSQLPTDVCGIIWTDKIKALQRKTEQNKEFTHT